MGGGKRAGHRVQRGLTSTVAPALHAEHRVFGCFVSTFPLGLEVVPAASFAGAAGPRRSASSKLQ
jgi:hypothetical protein